MFALRRTPWLIKGSTRSQTKRVHQGRFPEATYPPGRNRAVDSQLMYCCPVVAFLPDESALGNPLKGYTQKFEQLWVVSYNISSKAAANMEYQIQASALREGSGLEFI
jgi:hypothetical protein